MIPQKKPSPRQQAPINNDEETLIDYAGATPSSGRKKSIIVILCIIGAAAIGLGAYFNIRSKQKAKEAEEAEKAEERRNQFYDEAMQNLKDYEQELLLEEERYKSEDEENELPEPEEIELPEEILNVEKVTEIVVVDDYDKYPTKENETSIGTVNIDQGTEDLNVIREHKNDVTLDESKPADVPAEKIFTSVEQMPQFPGGEAAMLKYLSDHIVYPPMAQENNVQGRVVVQFVIKKDGSIGDVKVVRGKDPDLDREAVRVVKTFPKFTPGKMNGQPVNVWYTLPINFKLQQ